MQVINIGEVIVFNASQAEKIQQLGFKYIKRKIDNKEAFVFIQTNELMKELSQNFDKSSFLVSPTVKF